VTSSPALPALHETGAYRPGSPRLHRLALPLLRRFDRRRLSLLGGVAPPPARLLDVGAGRGRFVAAARAAGYDALALEPSARGAQAAAELGVPVRAETVERAQLPAGEFEVICAWHVLEHLQDPGGALERIAGWLAPGGTLLLGVPNLASLQARVGGECWYHLDVPRHRVHFTPRGLAALLDSSGLEPIRCTHLLAEHNPFGMWQSLVNRATVHPSYLYNLLKRNAPLHARDLALSLAALPLAPGAAALELAAGLARHGGTIAVLARRLAVPPGRAE
jgi:SAM-dependent methyltransferase